MNRMAFHTNPNIDKIVRDHYCKNSNYFFDAWHQKYFSLLHKKITSDDWKDLYNAILKDCETILKTDLKETSDIFGVTHS
jgi:catalase (peroxidase I)